ncbi:hypothetical protein [Sulfurimonas sp.]|uniref:glycosyltransferase family protein n=1 Tax=Sulfurimonas sp. TaxID=2022749 RepID=UPI003565708C
MIDTYFLDYNEAHKVASQQNRPVPHMLQVCYYAGDKMETDLVNLIHLPFESFVHSLGEGVYRLPRQINLDGLNLSNDVKEDIVLNFKNALEQAKRLRHEFNKNYLIALQNTKLDFSEKLRFYIPANSSTQVMQYVSKNIADELIKRGYEVFFDMSYGMYDPECKRNLLVFNPHAIININYFNSFLFSKDLFYFVWFQDSMPLLTNNQPINLKDRDYIFSYHKIFTDLLLKKGVDKNKIFKYDIIPVDTNQFYLDETIKKEDKIIFVGSYYADVDYIDTHKDIHNDIMEVIENGDTLSSETLIEIFAKKKVDVSDKPTFINRVQQAYVRTACVSWISQNTSKEVEVYGSNWKQSKNDNIIDKFKGKAEKDDLNRIYNSAKYVLSASASAINTQRLGELVHSGAIPVVYDCRDLTHEENTWDDECLYFKTQDELNYILDNNIKPKKYMSKEMLEHFTYDEFMNIIFEQINKKTKK